MSTVILKSCNVKETNVKILFYEYIIIDDINI